jgi:hypothetical protein
MRPNGNTYSLFSSLINKSDLWHGESLPAFYGQPNSRSSQVSCTEYTLSPRSNLLTPRAVMRAHPVGGYTAKCIRPHSSRVQRTEFEWFADDVTTRLEDWFVHVNRIEFCASVDEILDACGCAADRNILRGRALHCRVVGASESCQVIRSDRAEDDNEPHTAQRVKTVPG